ncbi:MAG: hypothetical protein ACFFD4_36450 [Candidatus Odinarchaeota archaeon]
MNQSLKTFLHFELKTKGVIIGERTKGGTFRPCIDNLPTSTLKGTFRRFFGLEDVLAIGFFKKQTYQRSLFVHAPFDTFLGTAKLPLTVECLTPAGDFPEIIADVYAVNSRDASILKTCKSTGIYIGAFKSKGFGKCTITYTGEVKSNIRTGYLKGRLLEEESIAFGITKIIKQNHGYLFYPLSLVDGVYKKALFENSIIKGPEILIHEEYEYDD